MSISSMQFRTSRDIWWTSVAEGRAFIGSTVYLDAVRVATPPKDYEERMVQLYPGMWQYLRLCALEVHDIALSKLERNSERDRHDVQQLARAGFLNPETLQERYHRELRPNLLAHETRHDLTLKLWLEAFWP
jgi:hypothetical protein